MLLQGIQMRNSMHNADTISSGNDFGTFTQALKNHDTITGSHKQTQSTPEEYCYIAVMVVLLQGLNESHDRARALPHTLSIV
jgi:hypothetical protein